MKRISEEIARECAEKGVPVEKIKGLSKEDKQPVVLVTTGAMCPLHNGHVNMFLQAKHTLEKLPDSNLEVVAGFISPKNDSYVSCKYPPSHALDISTRLELIKLSCEEYDWLNYSNYEAEICNGRRDMVLAHIQTVLNYNFPDLLWFGKQVEAWYVCGSDRLPGTKRYNVVGLVREERREIDEKYWGRRPKRLLIAKDRSLHDVSATKVRRAISNGLPTTGMLPDHVSQYIDQLGLFSTNS
eukprot:CAMPEP_0174268970 /NCGR_PEP_ID=MMETSP0439-20130205/39350_1 /TAXON_ID=0 /ORGANISM="Stereomyxa ramosa, Strain Chinc5" /LENGTH=240 /DNA_ID=CAMNT_0015357471 /DNA_START=106 /DNA_END=828 /DNA_ORIENTATION=-